MKSRIAVNLQNVTKKYLLTHEKPTLSEKILLRRKTEVFTALSNINLTIKKGEKVGVFGKNGAGKTTLLKIITGITTPTSGTVTTVGQIGSLIEPSAGFHPDLSGLENIMLNGMLLGMSKSFISSQKESIIEFADIGGFIDAPFYTYSEGMKLRLGFSVALHSDPDIFIIDEAIFTGDEGFRQKISQKLEEMSQSDKTIIFVSHMLWFIEQFASKFILIENAHLTESDSVDLLKKYENSYN